MLYACHVHKLSGSESLFGRFIAFATQHYGFDFTVNSVPLFRTRGVWDDPKNAGGEQDVKLYHTVWNATKIGSLPTSPDVE